MILDVFYRYMILHRVIPCNTSNSLWNAVPLLDQKNTHGRPVVWSRVVYLACWWKSSPSYPARLWKSSRGLTCWKMVISPRNMGISWDLQLIYSWFIWFYDRNIYWFSIRIGLGLSQKGHPTWSCSQQCVRPNPIGSSSKTRFTDMDYVYICL